MFNAVQGVNYYAHSFTWSENLCSFTWSENLCSLLYLHGVTRKARSEA